MIVIKIDKRKIKLYFAGKVDLLEKYYLNFLVLGMKEIQNIKLTY